jgi:hypothetical protein
MIFMQALFGVVLLAFSHHTINIINMLDNREPSILELEAQ